VTGHSDAQSRSQRRKEHFGGKTIAVVKFIERQSFKGRLSNHRVTAMRVQSAIPVGFEAPG